MCGIHGFNFINRALDQKMVEVARHRGPDSSGEYISKHWSLGFNRLAIIDLSTQGNQPMKSRDGRYVIVFNGEIYNYKELKEELLERGYQFSSETDTEVILAAYTTWREACLEKLNGMFAFAILNTHTEEVFLVRDRVGIKPLYYSQYQGKFIFSSEIKALFAHDISREIDQESLNSYFRMHYIPAPRTIWKHIHKLEPGHWMKITAQGVQKHKYWGYTNQPLLHDRNEIEHEIQELLSDSVKRQCIADRPIGVFLSGGIDSTIITGLMAELSNKVQTFSAGYEETEESEKYNNDMELAKRTAEHFGTDHHEYRFSASDILEQLPRAIYHMDEPISNHIQAVNLLLAQAVAPHATVVLGGDGGDELFGGYERYYYMHLFDRLRRIPEPIRNNPLTKFLFSSLGKSGMYNKLNESSEALRYLDFFAQKEKVISSFLKESYNLPEANHHIFQELYFTNRSTEAMDFTRLAMRMDVQSWLSNESLARSDKMSMAASIEQRVPFLDHRLVEFADRIPVEYKLGKKGIHVGTVGKHYEGKVILKSAMKKYIPEFILGQQKWGWFSPAAKWIRGPLLPLMQEVLSPSFNEGTRDMFDFPALQIMLEKHISKEKYALTPLWSILTFQLWYRQYLEK